MNTLEQKLAGRLQKELDEVNNPSWEKQLDAIYRASKEVPITRHGHQRQFLYIAAIVIICAASIFLAVYYFGAANSDNRLIQTENSHPASTGGGYFPASLQEGSIPAENPNTYPTLAQSEEVLLKLQRQDYANKQNDLLMQAGTPSDYAGTALDENSNLVIYITGSLENFIKAFDKVLDFQVITVKQVTFSWDQLENVQSIFTDLLKNDGWSRLNIVGCGIDVYANKVEVVVLQSDKDNKAEIEKIALIPGIMKITVQIEEYKPA